NDLSLQKEHENVDMEAVGEDNNGLVDDEHLSPEERRKANKQIEKNFATESKGKKKKTPRIAKTKNRKRYKEAVKKVRSQVGTVRKEIQKYSGESRGIRGVVTEVTAGRYVTPGDCRHSVTEKRFH
ncbi:Sas10 protein, partial [Ancylostoma duodenale]